MSAPDIVLTLPIPPSANALWRHASGKARERTPEYTAWLRAAGWTARTQLLGAQCLTGCFRAEITVPAGSRRDRDNWTKPLFDLCQHVHAIRNDSGLREYIVTASDRGDVLVALWAVPGPEQREPATYRASKPRAPRMMQGRLAALRRAGWPV